MVGPVVKVDPAELPQAREHPLARPATVRRAAGAREGIRRVPDALRAQRGDGVHQPDEDARVHGGGEADRLHGRSRTSCTTSRRSSPSRDSPDGVRRRGARRDRGAERGDDRARPRAGARELVGEHRGAHGAHHPRRHAHARVARRASAGRSCRSGGRPSPARVPRSRPRARTSATERAVAHHAAAAKMTNVHVARAAAALGGLRVHAQPRGRRRSTISSSSRATTAGSTTSTGWPSSGSARSAIPSCGSASSALRAGGAPFAWHDAAMDAAARARHRADRRPRAPRQRSVRDESPRRRLRRRAGGVRARGGGAVSVGHALHAGERAAHDGAVQRAVRRLVSAPCATTRASCARR